MVIGREEYSEACADGEVDRDGCVRLDDRMLKGCKF